MESRDKVSHHDFGLNTEDEYAQIKGVTVAAVRAQRAAGLGPKYVKLGRKIFITDEAILEEIAAKTVTPPRGES